MATFAEVLTAMDIEGACAIRKHGVRRTPLNPDMPATEKLVIVVEEVGEVARAMTYDEGDRHKLRAELIQVATMAAMWAASLE